MKSEEKRKLLNEIKEYWNQHIHDLEIVQHPVGSQGFFEDLDEYRFDKLRYLPTVVDFKGYNGKKVLEIGCGAGIDLIRFARGGAEVTGVDLSETAIDLAKKNFQINGLKADLRVMNGEALEFRDKSFDLVYVHGVLQYTADSRKMVEQSYRVLKEGGEFIGMVYNAKGWLMMLSKLMKVGLEHEDAPVLDLYTIKEFKELLSEFKEVKLVPERFPVKTRLHKGLKAFFYNTLFVNMFNLIPRSLVRPWGWHIMAFGIK